jgi:ABC-type dipeptide/oligopeptide/nickel transport system permease component
MGLYYRISLKFVLTTIGIVLISAIPALFQGFKVDFSAYIAVVGSIVSSLAHPDALLPHIWGRWQYSITVILAAFVISFLLAMVLTYFTMLLPEKVRRKIKFMLFLGESIPDVFVVGLFMVMVILIYKQTNFLIFNIAAFGEERIFVLPIIVLTILPTLLFYRIMIYDFEEEASQLYIDVARSKGLTTQKILFSHILRNAIINIFLHAKSMIWFMLSNLLIVEYVFNADGIMRFMFDNYTPEILTIGVLLMFIPIYVVQAIVQIIIEKTTGRQVEV